MYNVVCLHRGRNGNSERLENLSKLLADKRESGPCVFDFGSLSVIRKFPFASPRKHATGGTCAFQPCPLTGAEGNGRGTATPGGESSIAEDANAVTTLQGLFSPAILLLWPIKTSNLSILCQGR